MARRSVLLLVTLAVLAAGLALLAKTWCGVPAASEDLYLRWCYSDVPPLWFAERLHEGAIPYLDHPVEYPVLTGAAMGLAAIPSDGPASFMLWTAVLLAAGALVTARLLVAEVGPTRTLAFVAAPTLVISGMVNWDLLVVPLATAGLVAHRRGRDTAAGVLLGLGAATKLYPALFVVPLALAAWRLRGSRAGARTAGAAAGAWLAVNLPVALVAREGWGEFFRLSRERPSDWDALYTVAMRITGWEPATATVNLLSAVAFLVGAVVLIAYTVRRDPPERWHLVVLPLLAWFLLSSKVYSPQFSVWLLPLFALAFPGWGAWGAFAVADIAVTATRFRYLANFVGGGLEGAWPWEPFGAALVLRAAVLVAVAWLGWRRAVAEPAEPTDERRLAQHAMAPT